MPAFRPKTRSLTFNVMRWGNSAAIVSSRVVRPVLAPIGRGWPPLSHTCGVATPSLFGVLIGLAEPHTSSSICWSSLSARGSGFALSRMGLIQPPSRGRRCFSSAPCSPRWSGACCGNARKPAWLPLGCTDGLAAGNPAYLPRAAIPRAGSWPIHF